MNLEDEIYHLAAVNRALQSLFANLCIGIIRTDYANSEWISQVFDHSANEVEDWAIRFGESANPKHVNSPAIMTP